MLGEALTKEQHDALVERLGRPITQRPRTRRLKSGPTHDGVGVTAMSDGLARSRQEANQ